MRFAFRTKLLAITGPAILGFVVLIIAQTILARRMSTQIGKIQSQYIPIIEFGPKLETGFEHLRRAFQDGVAAQDKEALQKAHAFEDKLLTEVNEAKSVIDSTQVADLEHAIKDYYDAATDVSHRLIAGETGTSLVNSMTEMQDKQAVVDTILKDALTFDRTKLETAFATIEAAQTTSVRTLIALSIASLLLVLVLSGILGRKVLESLSLLSDGLARFGRGEFTESISITSHDEFEKLAQDANQMAARIRSLIRELESFSYSVAHDLRAPLRSMLGFSNIILEDYGATFSKEARDSLERVIAAAKKMAQLVDSLLSLSRLARTEMKRNTVNLSQLSQGIVDDLQAAQPDRKATVNLRKDVLVQGDSSLLQIVLTNLLNNAWKFTSKRDVARIEFGMEKREGTEVYFVRDNGAGFDMQYASKLFGTFQRLHSNEEFEGTGVGLATVQTIIRRHGGDIWAESKVDHGATFFFTIGKILAFKNLESRSNHGNSNDLASRGQS